LSHLFLIVVSSAAALGANATTRPTTPTRIVLDPTTFPKISRPLLQETADQVAKTVDELIPGGYPNSSSSTILCFVTHGNWTDKPRAIVGKPWTIEPPTASRYVMRVAFTPQVLPGAWQRLAFQLAHELAHLKMDARVDNNALESFAVAVSLEVLHRLDYDSYRESNERYYTQSIPPEALAALNGSDWAKVGLYLRYEWRQEYSENWDQGTHFVAAIALRKIAGFPWERLLNIGASAECGSNRSNGRARYCPLSPASLVGFPEALKSIVLPDQVNVALEHIGKRQDNSAALTFQEKGKSVSLRWSRRTDPLLPDGFVPIN
jgi:hypothetical protein